MSTRAQSVAEMLMQAYRLQLSGCTAEAYRAARRIVAISPRNPDVLNLLSVLEHAAAKYEQALVRIDQAIALKPSAAIYHANRGGTLTDLGRLDEAIEAYRRALRLNPDLADAHNGLAFALRCASRLEEAEANAREALRRAPRDDSLHSNLGCLLADMGRPEEALECYRESLCLRAKNPEAQYNRAMTLLLSGRLPEGWREYEARWQMPRHAPRGFRQPQWHGEPLMGRTLLVHHEEGFGDSIQFCRYVPLAAQSGRVILEVPRDLVRLLGSLDGLTETVVRGEALPDFDLHCPMLSLPGAFATKLDDIPALIPYLHPRPADTAKWQQRMVNLEGLRVGLVWAGNPEIPSVDRKRSIEPEKLAALRAVQTASFISLQKGTGVEARNAPWIIDWTADLEDFADTAALVASLDLVIGVDTSVIHLAGALGKPVWLLNRFETCWRWLLDREDSPWYPTLRLFRQSRPGEWDSVLARVRAELQVAARAAGQSKH